MELKLEEFRYELPEERIAKHPPEKRGNSKLLFYNKGPISHHSFAEIPDLIPKNALLVFNDTRVIPARVIMYKESGARIEIFLLEPIAPSKVHEQVMDAKKECTWKCMIGNAKKWKLDSSLKIAELKFNAHRISQDQVAFTWEKDISFADLLVEIGKIPLPPYIEREAEELDQERYQTVYSKVKGAVAAPTAGLHFTNEILASLEEKGIQKDFLTLHVSAGTFQPIKVVDIQQHPMHNEQIWVSKDNIENVLNSEKTIAIGTTSMRTLESLYWYGVKLLNHSFDFTIYKEDPYQLQTVAKEQALEAVLMEMKRRNKTRIGGQTEIFLYPGYDFKVCEGLVTNYHLPGSTLILLVAAFVGGDWKNIYQEALSNDYRFLSYGDSSLLLR